MDMSVQLCLQPPASGGEARPRDEPQGVSLREFLAGNYGQLHRRLKHQLGCADMASECLHDAWLRLGGLMFAGVQAPEAYVFRVACNAAVDRIRNDRPWQYAGDADNELEHLADEAPGPGDIAAGRSNLAAMDRALAQLSRRHRTVLVALRVDEMTREQVASRYGLSLRSVDTALRQALDHCAASPAGCVM